jgi:DNA-binding NarL/FixJ family response regulator
MPMKQILVIAPPGRLRDGLQVLLETIQDTSVMGVASADAAQTQVALRPPQLVIIAGQRAQEMLAAFAGNCQNTYFLLLVKHARHKAAAEAAGADAVLVEGTTAERLLNVVRDLLATTSPKQTEVKDDH